MCLPHACGFHQRPPAPQRSSAPGWEQAIRKLGTVLGPPAPPRQPVRAGKGSFQPPGPPSLTCPTPHVLLWPETSRAAQAVGAREEGAGRAAWQHSSVRAYPPLGEFAEGQGPVADALDSRLHKVRLGLCLLLWAQCGHELLPVSCDLAREGPGSGSGQPSSPGSSVAPLCLTIRGVALITSGKPPGTTAFSAARCTNPSEPQGDTAPEGKSWPSVASP